MERVCQAATTAWVALQMGSVEVPVVALWPAAAVAAITAALYLTRDARGPRRRA